MGVVPIDGAARPAKRQRRLVWPAPGGACDPGSLPGTAAMRLAGGMHHRVPPRAPG